MLSAIRFSPVKIPFSAKKHPAKTQASKVIELPEEWLRGFNRFYQSRESSGGKGNGAVSLALYLQQLLRGRGKQTGWLPSSQQIADSLNEHQPANNKPIAASLVRRALNIAGSLTGRILPSNRAGYQVVNSQRGKLSPQLILNSAVAEYISTLPRDTSVDAHELTKAFNVSEFQIRSALSVAVAKDQLEYTNRGHRVVQTPVINGRTLTTISFDTVRRMQQAKETDSVLDKVEVHLKNLQKKHQNTNKKVVITALRIAKAIKIGKSSAQSALQHLAQGAGRLVNKPEADSKGHTLVIPKRKKP